MSRIGKQPIKLPKGVTLRLDGDVIQVQGPKGRLQQKLHKRAKIAVEGDTVRLTRTDDSSESRAVHGLMRALTQNMVAGVSSGFSRRLDITGVGYRAELKGKQLIMQLGYSHPVEYDLPDGVSAKVEKSTITLSSIDKELLGHTAAKVRSFRPPEPYKGKGIRYAGEHVQRKVGKTGAG